MEAARPSNLILSASRLRQAWRSLKRARDEDDVIKRAGQDTMDMDDMLTASVLDDIEARHWARYKMTWPPEIAPAGTLISRIVREFEKRTLSVQMVFKVRTQAHQQKDVRKRTRVAEGLEMVSAAVSRDATPSLHNYMTNLVTLLIAYSEAGSKLRVDAPTAEPKTVDSTRIVECPLDVLMRYCYRVQDRAYSLQYHMALSWIQRKDEAERTVWVDRFRNSTGSLFEIILHTLQTREAMWELPTPEIRQTKAPGGAKSGAKRKPTPGAGAKARPGKPQSRSVLIRCVAAPGCAVDSTRESAPTAAGSATTRADAASSSPMGTHAVASMLRSSTGETPRSWRNRPQEAGRSHRMRPATIRLEEDRCRRFATSHQKGLQTPLRRQARMVGPANSFEETGNLHQPANSLEETGNRSLPANSREETGLRTLWMYSRARMHQLRAHWLGADGVLSQ